MADLNVETIRGAMRFAEVPDAPVHYFDETGSTNATAIELAREGAPEWTVVAAGHQTAGRGRLGRTWVSPPGSALLCSIVLRPDMPPDRAALLGLLAGTGMSRACAEAGATGVRCKWPNDLLVGERKVGGILTEAGISGGEVEHVVLGVGVNLGAAPDVEGAGALPGVDPVELLGFFLAELWSDYGHGGRRRDFAERVVERYRGVCSTLGRRVRATTRAGAVVEGTARDVDVDGALVVEAGGRSVTVGFGEIQHLR